MGSKSLKQFRTSFRKHGALHDECTALVGRRIAGAIKPLWLRVGGYGIRVAASRSTCSGRPARHRGAPGCAIQAWRRIAAVG